MKHPKFDWTGMPVPSEKATEIAETIINDPIGSESFSGAVTSAKNSNEPYLQLMVWALVGTGLDLVGPENRLSREIAMAKAVAPGLFEQFRAVIEGKIHGVCTYGDPGGTLIKEAQDPPDMSGWFNPPA